MHVFGQAFWIQKHGNDPEEYEDAYWPTKPVESKESQIRFAVADGATETSFSGLWARLLVREYCRREIRAENLELSLPKLRHLWRRLITKKPLPWYAEEKLRAGAFASFLGFTLSKSNSDDSSGKWQSMAVGDSCICHVRNEHLLSSFPIEHSSDFSSRPLLLSSERRNTVPESEVREKQEVWELGDTFYLMSDAVACWFLRKVESSDRPWHVLRDLDTNEQRESFEVWINQLRCESLIKNDDVTILRVSVV